MRTCPNCGQTKAPDTGNFCTVCGSSLIAQKIPATPIEIIAPEPPERGVQFTWLHKSKSSNQNSSNAAPGLPPPPQAWSFQDQLTEAAANIIGSLGQTAAQPNFAGRVVRATLVDKTIYREVAADVSRQNEATVILIAVAVLGSLGFSWLSASALSLSGLLNLITIALVQLVALAAKVWVVQTAASLWLGKRSTFYQLYRGLAYAQSPAALQVIPIVGLVAGLWCMVTNTAAIRDIVGCDTVQAAILAIAGVAGVLLAAYFAAPIIGM